MESILAKLLFGWILAALAAGTPPAQFDANGVYTGHTSPSHAAVYGRLK